MKTVREDFVLAVRLVYAKFLLVFIYFEYCSCHLSRISSSDSCNQCCA